MTDKLVLPAAVTQPNGVVLDFRGGWAAGLTEYARRKGFAWLAAKATGGPDSLSEYVLMSETEFLWHGPSYEAACCWIDIMAADRDFPRE